MFAVTQIPDQFVFSFPLLSKTIFCFNIAVLGFRENGGEQTLIPTPPHIQSLSWYPHQSGTSAVTDCSAVTSQLPKSHLYQCSLLVLCSDSHG